MKQDFSPKTTGVLAFALSALTFYLFTRVVWFTAMISIPVGIVAWLMQKESNNQ